MSWNDWIGVVWMKNTLVEWVLDRFLQQQQIVDWTSVRMVCDRIPENRGVRVVDEDHYDSCESLPVLRVWQQWRQVHWKYFCVLVDTPLILRKEMVWELAPLRTESAVGCQHGMMSLLHSFCRWAIDRYHRHPHPQYSVSERMVESNRS